MILRPSFFRTLRSVPWLVPSSESLPLAGVTDDPGRRAAAHWSPHLPATTVRFARPTTRLAACASFYRDALGLEVLAEFHDHDGYSGLVFGLPDRSAQLELTERGGAPALPAPTPEHQLVFYVGDEARVAEVEFRLRAAGVTPVPAENPYWTRRGARAFTDPDGWVVILAPWAE